MALKLIVCVDDRMGMLFNRRRQSEDRALRTHILQETAYKPLWMNAYSARQFGAADKIIISETCLEQAGAGEFCFVENLDVAPYMDKIEQVTVYRWNRKYPADFYFTLQLAPPEWKLLCSEEFAGSSHEKITKDVYLHEKFV